MDSRKLKILAAVVDEYIMTGEPVGSKTVMNHVKASSATIRNEMAELEKQGYLEQPHTSAGRVPTYEGYRLYVDSLMEKNTLSDDDKNRIDELFPETAVYDSDDEMFESASYALAELTKCAAVVASTAPKFSLISKVEVIPTGKRMYVILMITSNGSIKNKVCRLQFDLTHEQLAFFESFAKENLEGIAVDKLSDEFFEKLSEAMGTYMMSLSPIVSALMNMSQEITSHSVKVEGQKNLLTCKEFDQNEIITFLDNQNDEIKRFLNESFSGLKVHFSPEDGGFVIHNSSIITAPIEKSGISYGSLGLIGPMRIDYAKFIPYLEYFADRITRMISKEDDDDEQA